MKTLGDEFSTEILLFWQNSGLKVEENWILEEGEKGCMIGGFWPKQNKRKPKERFFQKNRKLFY